MTVMSRPSTDLPSEMISSVGGIVVVVGGRVVVVGARVVVIGATVIVVVVEASTSVVDVAEPEAHDTTSKHEATLIVRPKLT